MGNDLEYKGYYAKIEYNSGDQIAYGKIAGIKDLVFFESESIEEIEKEFHLAVDDYLDMCEDIGQKPDKVDCKDVAAEVAMLYESYHVKNDGVKVKTTIAKGSLDKKLNDGICI